MSILFTSIILSLLAALAIFLIIYGYARSKKHPLRYYKNKLWYMLLGGMFLLTNLFNCFVTVGANQVGIIYDELNGGVQTKTFGEGFHGKSIFQTITKISTSNKNETIVSTGQTMDSVYAEFTISIIYRIEVNNAGLFFKATNSDDISKLQLESTVKESLQSSTIQMDIYDLLGNKLEDCRLAFVEDLKQKLSERFYVTLISASFDDIDAGSRVEEVIKTKAEAQQQLEIAELEKQKQEIEAKTMAIKAEAEAEVARIAAKGNGDALEISAKAEAEKIKLEKTAVAEMISSYKDKFTTLSEEDVALIVLKTIYIDKWDGILPETFVGMNFDELLDAIVSLNP